MKLLCILALTSTAFLSCSDTQNLNDRVDDLTVRMAHSYKPGFGEFMSAIQIHHAKLWFAGKNRNWPLAKFEIGEITETVKAIEEYETDRPEAKELPVLDPVLDSVQTAVQQHNERLFVATFTSLTRTCNGCHRAVNFPFNVVKIPDTPPFSNQDFSVHHQEH